MNEDYLSLTALTHLDGRNRGKLSGLGAYFSEFNWMKTRILVLIKWLDFLQKKKIIKKSGDLLKIYENFSLQEAKKILKIEKTTNHDLRAIQLYLSQVLKTDFIGFGLGSEDINNLALRLLAKGGFEKVLAPKLLEIKNKLRKFTKEHKSLTMLARTHAQPASVTTFGKETGLYLYRFTKELDFLINCKFSGKISGEAGNYNALNFVLPKLDWLKNSEEFISSFGLSVNLFATQINPYDDLIVFFDSLKRLNQVLLGFCKDLWLYSLLGYLKIAQVAKEAGSAGMPHKVNPIHLEGAEGGLEQANCLLEFFSRKLSYSRLQRDFSDSTVRRNFVLAFSYSLLSYQSLITGFERIEVNQKQIAFDLESHPEVFSEGLKTLMIFQGEKNAWEKVQTMVKNGRLKTRFKSLKDYSGLSEKLAELILQETQS